MITRSRDPDGWSSQWAGLHRWPTTTVLDRLLGSPGSLRANWRSIWERLSSLEIPAKCRKSRTDRRILLEESLNLLEYLASSSYWSLSSQTVRVRTAAVSFNNCLSALCSSSFQSFSLPRICFWKRSRLAPPTSTISKCPGLRVAQKGSAKLIHHRILLPDTLAAIHTPLIRSSTPPRNPRMKLKNGAERKERRIARK